MTSLSDPKPARRLKVVVTGGHPGDPEYGCGGTIARYVSQGHEVTLFYLNNGEIDDPENLRTHLRGVRVAEAQAACDILRAKPLYAGQIDGNSIVDNLHYAEFQNLLESERPDVVLTHWPIDNHPDHRALWTLVYNAWALGGRKFGLYYYEVSNGEDTLLFSPTHYVDISEVEPQKRSACYAHASQSPDFFYAIQARVTVFRGMESGHAQAEAFIRQIPGPVDLLP